jgi:hypothetical protein
VIEIKIKITPIPDGRWRTRFWAPLSLAAEQKNSRGQDRSVSVLDE